MKENDMSEFTIKGCNYIVVDGV